MHACTRAKIRRFNSWMIEGLSPSMPVFMATKESMKVVYFTRPSCLASKTHPSGISNSKTCPKQNSQVRVCGWRHAENEEEPRLCPFRRPKSTILPVHLIWVLLVPMQHTVLLWPLKPPAGSGLTSVILHLRPSLIYFNRYVTPGVASLSARFHRKEIWSCYLHTGKSFHSCNDIIYINFNGYLLWHFQLVLQFCISRGTSGIAGNTCKGVVSILQSFPGTLGTQVFDYFSLQTNNSGLSYTSTRMFLITSSRLYSVV